MLSKFRTPSFNAAGLDRDQILQNTTLLFIVSSSKLVHLPASLQKPFFTPQIPRKCVCLHCESGKSGLKSNITLHCALPAQLEEGWAIRLGWVGRKAIHAFVPYHIFEEVGGIVRTEIVVKNGNKNKLDRIKWHKRTSYVCNGREGWKFSSSRGRKKGEGQKSNCAGSGLCVFRKF